MRVYFLFPAGCLGRCLLDAASMFPTSPSRTRRGRTEVIGEGARRVTALLPPVHGVRRLARDHR